MKPKKNHLKRCRWVNELNPLSVDYHDQEWGEPNHDDYRHFEMLILEGAQAGLSWETILMRRKNYRRAFKNFDASLVAAMSEQELEILLKDEGLIRNRRKIWSARENAKAFVAIQNEFGSFDAYVWNFVQGQSIVNRKLKNVKPITNSPESLALSRDLKRRGMSFVGPTIMYAYMQAVGLVDDHEAQCFRSENVSYE